MRKKIPVLCMMAVLLCHANAQDTIVYGDGSIYMVPPAVKDTIPHWFYWDPSNTGLAIEVFVHRTDECDHMISTELNGEVYVADDSTLIYGVALHVYLIEVSRFDTSSHNRHIYDGWENGSRDSAIWAIIVRKTHSDDRILYERVDSVLWHTHAASRTLLYPIYGVTANGDRDTMWLPTPMYELYFDHPVMMKDTFYVCTRPTYGWEINSNNSRPCLISRINYNRVLVTNGIPPYQLTLEYDQVYGYHYGGSHMGVRFPILVPPDTDAVPQCMVPADLHKSGQRVDYPLLAWDTTEGGQREYELQFAPYDSEAWVTLRPQENPVRLVAMFDTGTYYKARIRARCHHGCPVHNVWSWSPWSDTILFYTGQRPPDTTSTGTDTTAVTPVEADGGSLFTLTPNPTTGRVTVEVKSDKLKDKSGVATLNLRDAAGHEMMRQVVTQDQTAVDLDLSSLPAGAYFVTLSTPASSATQRLLVK